jgi:hypothetical protein
MKRTQAALLLLGIVALSHCGAYAQLKVGAAVASKSPPPRKSPPSRAAPKTPPRAPPKAPPAKPPSKPAAGASQASKLRPPPPPVEREFLRPPVPPYSAQIPPGRLVASPPGATPPGIVRKGEPYWKHPGSSRAQCFAMLQCANASLCQHIRSLCWISELHAHYQSTRQATASRPSCGMMPSSHTPIQVALPDVQQCQQSADNQHTCIQVRCQSAQAVVRLLRHMVPHGAWCLMHSAKHVHSSVSTAAYACLPAEPAPPLPASLQQCQSAQWAPSYGPTTCAAPSARQSTTSPARSR